MEVAIAIIRSLYVTDRRHRPKGLKPGEVCLFEDFGRRVFLMRDRVVIEGVDSPIEIETSNTITIKGSKIVLDAPVEATSSVAAKGDISDRVGSGGSSMSGMRSVYNGHTHKHCKSSSDDSESINVRCECLVL